MAPEIASLADRPRTLVVHSCSVAASTFGADGDSEVRSALIAFAGYLLGGPIALHKETAGRGPTFMAQLTEDFDLPLGDTGQLYSYTDQAKWDCR
jgi:hypothetical protein